MIVAIEKPEAADVMALLEYHVADARRNSPPELSFALPGSALLAEEITFWTVREAEALLGFGALKDLGDKTGEVKSMRTAHTHLRRGVAALVLETIIKTARERGYSKLYLETGGTEPYRPARRFYESMGFMPCHPFADYEATGFNYFMQLVL